MSNTTKAPRVSASLGAKLVQYTLEAVSNNEPMWFLHGEHKYLVYPSGAWKRLDYTRNPADRDNPYKQ